MGATPLGRAAGRTPRGAGGCDATSLSTSCAPATTHSWFLASLSISELREPGTGASAFSRPPTHRDLPGSFALTRRSPFDFARPPRTSRTYMACRRSGVRIPLAPLRSRAGFELETGFFLRIQQQSTAAGQAPALALFLQATRKYAGAARPRMESRPVNRRSTQVSVVLASAATGGVVAATGLIRKTEQAIVPRPDSTARDQRGKRGGKARLSERPIGLGAQLVEGPQPSHGPRSRGSVADGSPARRPSRHARRCR